MKKILLLGGSKQQLVAIKTAHELGYYTVLCDYLPDNPGQYIADKFYQVSTTDFDCVLEVAKKEDISGIVAYASDPAAPTAAYVANLLKLPSNPYHSVEILSKKNLFRAFLEENNFNVPLSLSLTSQHITLNNLNNLHYPLIIKPVDSSGSKGISVANDFKEVQESLKIAFTFSRSSRVIIEEFLVKDHEYLIGGDIFVKNGKIEYMGLLNCHRDLNVNPLVPVGKSYPLMISQSRIEFIKIELTRLLNLLDIQFGAFNVEMLFSNDKLYFIECGPRNGGNMIPDLLKLKDNVNLVDATIKSSMGRVDYDLKCNDVQEYYYSTYNLHSDKDGIMRSIKFKPKYKEKIFDTILYKFPKDKIEFFDGANKAIGITFLKNNSEEEMLDMMNNPKKWVSIIID